MKSKLEMQPVPINWEEASLPTCQERLLNREFVRLIKKKVLKMAVWSSLVIWALWTHHLVTWERKEMYG